MDALSEFMRYLANHQEVEAQNLPALTELSRELGVSVASLREQLEVARALGLVDVRPRTGIRRLAYTFRPAVTQSLGYAMQLDKGNFDLYADLRRHLESAYWHEAVGKLTEEDHAELRSLLARAWEKLHGPQPEIPHSEHRKLHLLIYRRLDNPFVMGLLEAYWDAYEAVGLHFYTDFNYLEEVWQYHQKMVDSICSRDYEAGFNALTEHTDLIFQVMASSKK
ncbi:MAG: FadR/GntR family transcriptional regulator [Chloroflexota bacterium]|jgi:DNA-binding FadR family transcriptional regulator